MFPPSSGKPSRTPIPIWTIAAGAVLLVVVLLIGLVAVAGPSHSSSTAAPSVPGVNASGQTSALEASLVTASDLGPDWATTRTVPDGPSDLAWDEACFASPGLQSVATAGMSTDISYRPGPTRDEEGYAQSHVLAYSSAHDAAEQVRARGEDGFRACIAEFDTQAVACSCGIVPQDVGVQPVAAPTGLNAVMYENTLTYNDNGVQTYHVIRAYLSEGQYFGVLTVARKNASPDRTQFEELLRTFQQRLLVHAPT